MSISFLIALAFVTAGFALFAAQVASYDAIRAYNAISDEINNSLGHDTLIYPDHIQ